MTPSTEARPWKHVGQRRGKIHQPMLGGSTTPRPAPKSVSGCGSGTHRRGKGQKLTGWQESEALATCATSANPNDTPDPASPGGGLGRSYGGPL